MASWPNTVRHFQDKHYNTWYSFCSERC